MSRPAITALGTAGILTLWIAGCLTISTLSKAMTADPDTASVVAVLLGLPWGAVLGPALWHWTNREGQESLA